MMLSELDLEDVEALHSGPSFLTADTLGPLLEHCDALFGLSSLEEPLSPSHAPPPEAKASDLMLPWLGASDLLEVECPQEEDDALLAMEWVSEKLELPELDLDSLLDSSDDCQDAVLTPEPHPEAAAVKSEPLSPSSGESPAERGDSDNDSVLDSGIESSPPHTPQSCRSTPYSRPQPDTKPPRAPRPRIKGVKTVEKKLKKMEQNKTAATRYRQKKRVEQVDLNTELQQLEKRNQELTEKAQAISRELQYLRDLMEEVRRHHHNKSRTAAK
ncbi:unnamed protein product [Knipowitschia caucasica]